MNSTPSSADGTGGGGGVNLNAAIAAVATTLDISNDLRLSYETRFAGLDKLSSAYIKGQNKEREFQVANKEKVWELFMPSYTMTTNTIPTYLVIHYLH